jgi:DNA invertase Pin-like site-specific DNA recombinase
MKLRSELQSRQLRVVALDLPTSWIMVKSDDPFTARMFEAPNAMMLDMLAAIARKDYDDRRRRQMQGIAKAKTEGKYRGRPEDKKRNTAIMNMLKRGMSWNSIIEAAGGSGTKLSRATLLLPAILLLVGGTVGASFSFPRRLPPGTFIPA